MTPITLTNESALDAQSVSAVRGGDVERYRELVERHERRVFAVAWSRLGDAGLAEEATQETFIRAYRRLWLLGDGAKFSGWIAAIGRRVAINLGLRHRRELNKRERWALEEISATNVTEEAAEPLTTETLRATLAELPEAYRECLVLFYLEGKSGAAAATALGISESALRVRLHRARAAMREQLETKLEGSLKKLKPAKTIVPAVMGAVLLSSKAKAATAGGTAATGLAAKILPALGKIFIFSWLMPLVSAVGSLPGMALGLWLGRMERKNFRDQEGFRARLHRGFLRGFIWAFPLMVVIIALMNSSALALGGLKAMFAVTLCLIAALVLLSARSLTICRNPFQIGMFIYGMIILAGVAALAAGWIRPEFGQMPIALATLVLLFNVKHRPIRMDYSLFLRAAQGLINVTDAPDDGPKSKLFDRVTLLNFARFLGSRWLAVNFRWERDGLALRLLPVKSTLMANATLPFLPPVAWGCSWILLRWNGSVAAHCGEGDAAALARLCPGRLTSTPELESLVAREAGSAWREFRNGNPAAAERKLGELPEEEVFHVSPARAKSTLWWRISLIATVVLMVVVMVLGWSMNRMRMVNGRFYEPVSVSEAEVRSSLERLGNPTDTNCYLVRELDYSEGSLYALPSKEMFSPAVWQNIQERLKAEFPAEYSRMKPTERLDTLLGYRNLEGGFLNGWLTTNDMQLSAEAARQALAGMSLQACDTRFGLRNGEVSDGKGGVLNYTILDVRNPARHLCALHKLGCPDPAVVATNAEILLRHQVLSASLPAGRKQDLDPKLMNGLFLTSGWDPIEDTYESLTILEAAGALGRVDREACIKGILRFYHGKGLFGSVREHDGFVIFGDTHDTLFAFESLRMLNALDRVNDLERWRFRPMASSEPATSGKPRVVTWEEIEAWIFQQRLERILRERKENPQAPVRSLLEP